MSVSMKVPEVGESITEVTVASWLKKTGDIVEMDEVLCELESDKATFELTAEVAGKLTIKAEEGDILEIGAVICEIDEDGQASAAPSEGSAPSTASKAQTGEVATSKDPTPSGESIEMRVPEVGESITEVTFSSWLKKDGEFVELDEVIAEIDSDKATFELPAEGSGILHPVAKDSDTLKIGDLICTIDLAEAPKALTPSKEPVTFGKETKQHEESIEKGYAAGHPSPAAGKILEEKGIDPQSVDGTGVGGRVTKQDALKAKSIVAGDKTGSETAKSAVSEGQRSETRKKMTSLRKTVSRRLVAVKNETAMLTTFNEVNMKPIMDIRKKYKESFKEKFGVGLGFMSFFTKASCQALLEWPAVNAQIDGDEMVYHDYCDISIAVSAPKGLVVPVIRNAESLSFNEIESEVVRLATKARENKLTIPEMTGGTFTITNGGIFGSMMSTPIINAPQSAILGMHNIVQRPMAVNGEVAILPMMYLALSYDHRIIDGRESVSFLVRLKELLEDPSRLMLRV